MIICIMISCQPQDLLPALRASWGLSSRKAVESVPALSPHRGPHLDGHRSVLLKGPHRGEDTTERRTGVAK